MSIQKRFDESKKLRTISESGSGIFQYGRSEGAPYLFFKREEFYDLMGHEINFYENGVLLTLKDSVKDFEESRSFVFFSNDGKKILDTHNRNSVLDETTNKRTIYPPLKDISVVVYNNFLFVTETNFGTGAETKYLIDVLTGEKHFDFTDSEQLSIEF